MAKQKLTPEEIQEALKDLPGWDVVGGKLHKEFKFDGFGQALGWMVAAGVQADNMDHHPEWTNVYNRVTVDLVTHDLDNSISNLDVELAGKMNKLAAQS
jgi:4a-hydroxytetrahydrobiopterin dehydratase